MSKPVKNIHLRALRGAVKGVRRPGHKMTAEQRHEAERRASVAEKSLAYQHLERREPLHLPNAEEQRRMRKKYAMQYSTQGYEARQHLFGPNGKKLKPEHRESLLAHVESVSRSQGSAMIPENLRRMQEVSKQLKGRSTLARVNGEWFDVGHVHGTSEGGYNKPYFIGVGIGYGMMRFIVWANNESDASDIAENTWPKDFFDEIMATSRLERKIEAGEEEEDHWAFIESIGKMGKRTEDIRMFAKASEVVYHAKKIAEHDYLYRAPDGRIIEAK